MPRSTEATQGTLPSGAWWPHVPPQASASRVRDAVRRAQHSALIVDFDDTLVLCNTTEAYLRSARPRWLARLVLGVLGRVLRLLLRSERLTFTYRDWLRVLVVTVLLPWTLPRWRRAAPRTGARARNDALLDALSGGGTKLVVTFGFAPLVRPLLPWVDAEARLVAASDLWRVPRLRKEGKRAALERTLGTSTIAGALVVTDSDLDADLLDACGTPLLLLWAEPDPDSADLSRSTAA